MMFKQPPKKQEKLQSLFYSFIENRKSIDDVDGVSHGPGINNTFIEDKQSFDDVDCVLPTPRIIQAEGGNLTSSIQISDYPFAFEGTLPASPLQFLALAPPLTFAQSSEVAAAGRHLAKLAAEYSQSHPEKSAIKFETSCMFVTPEEQVISIPVFRSDTCINKVTKGTWKTCEKTACSGTHYIASSGEIVFREGETKKIINIQILPTDEETDLRFTVELSDDNGIFSSKPLIIALKKTDHYSPGEKQVVANLAKSSPSYIEDINAILSDSLTRRTFHVALSHLCSKENAVPVQLALAFELGRLCLNVLREESILDILTDFFRVDDLDF